MKKKIKTTYMMTEEELERNKIAGEFIKSDGRPSLGHSVLLALGWATLQQVMEHLPQTAIGTIRLALAEFDRQDRKKS